jgi:transcriptional regulator with XRE-family HTH domain
VTDDHEGRSTGQRIYHFRTRLGLTRAVLGGLVGRSAEWVKAVESGRLLTPRLSLLIRLAEVLKVDDLALLTGEPRLASATYGRAMHEKLPVLTRALATYPMPASDVTPVPAPELAERVTQLWELWHGTKQCRTAISGLLPNLLRDAQLAVRLYEGTERRSALHSLAQTYHLMQLFLSFQPAPEMITLTGDRAFNAAQEADNPQAMAVAAWYLNHIFRDAGQQHEARVQLALDSAELLQPETSVEDRALWGLLHLAVALSYAKLGQDGTAWRYWDQAHTAARSLPDGYVHPYLIFGIGMVEAYAITMQADLMRGREATRQADRLDFDTIPSATRRSFHLIETARAYQLRRENLATVHLLQRAYDESPDTVRFNNFARSAVSELGQRGGTTVRAEVADLTHKLNLAG